MRLIETDEAEELGVVDGGHGHEAGDAGFLVGAVQLLAGAALTAHPVARDLGVPSAAVEHHSLHHLPHGAGGLFLEHPAAADRGEMVDDLALRAEDVRDNIGLHQPPAVDHGADRRRHLEVGDLAALAKGAGGQLHRSHPLGGVVEALFRLGRQVDAGGGAEAEGREVVAESLFAQPCPDLDEALVAGVFQRLRHGLRPVALVVGTVEAGACYRDGVAAVEAGMFADGPGVQRRRTGDELKNAARLVEVADGLVPPLGLLGQLERCRPLAAGQALHGLPGGFVSDHPGLIGVVGGGGGHGQHCPSVHVHDDAHGPGRHMVFLHCIAQRVLEVVLDVRVDGEAEAVPLGGRDLCLIALLEGVAPRIHGGQHHAVLAGEQVVILQLEARDACVVHVSEAQHRREKFSLRIPALGILLDADAGDAVGLAEVPDGVGGLTVHPVAEKTVVGAAVVELFQQLLFVQRQKVGKALGRKGKAVFRHLPGGGPEGPAAAVGREKEAVGAGDAAPVGGDDGVPQLLAEGALGVPAAAHHLQKQQPHRQPEADEAKHPRRKPRPGAEGPLRQGAQGVGIV